MGNTISDLAPAPLSPNTVATSYNKKGNYIINSTLGTGIYGIAYRVTHPSTNKLFAMKVLQTSIAAQLRRFREEATILATLSHPKIVALEDIGGIPDASNGSWNACIVTELADYNLVDFYAAYTALGISDLEGAIAQTVAHQLLAALSHLHERGLVHRDVKPANILVFWGPRSLPLTFKLADFGLAVHFFDPEDVAVPVARYTAPELLLQGYRAEEASKADIWALGKAHS
ncbi:hypothetical protein E4T48_03938 [Aureobasidium sp. EXF-10727]|nr:hypothetical protein E4T48_03938 [Aureobasidium sp. EXF-10727]